jgi:hypothetical protein
MIFPFAVGRWAAAVARLPPTDATLLIAIFVVAFRVFFFYEAQ